MRKAGEHAATISPISLLLLTEDKRLLIWLCCMPNRLRADIADRDKSERKERYCQHMALLVTNAAKFPGVGMQVCGISLKGKVLFGYAKPFLMNGFKLA